MSERVFVDSNVLIYAYDSEAGSKQKRAAEWLRTLWQRGDGRMSTQVLQEFYFNVTQKIRVPLGKTAARDVVRNYGPWVRKSTTPETVARDSSGG